MAGQRKALIIANDTYEHEALQNLRAPAADAAALGQVLGDPRIGDFAVRVVHNQPAHVISAQIEEVFSESRPDDVLLLHFSGHGLKSEAGELFFAGANTRPNRLGSTAVPAEFVQRCMREARSRSVVLLLDCCYGGAFAQGVKVRAAGDVHVLDSFQQGRAGGGRGRAVITASNAMEFAFEGDQLGEDQQRRPSVFTAALVEGLETGEADRDQDGWVSLDELYDYLFDKVREQTPHQTPSRQFDLEGELYLARSRRRRNRPIPADLQAALADSNIYTRLGAVSELRSRMASDNVVAAEGAYDLLTQLANSDISFVANAAAEALTEAAVQPAPRELHFGQIEQGSPPPHQTVRLAGPAIARACQAHSSDDWIHVDQTAAGLDISVDTTGSGTRRGSLRLKGPTGEAAIAIDIDLVSPAPLSPSVRSQTDQQPPASSTATRPAEGTPAVPAWWEAQRAPTRPTEEQARETAAGEDTRLEPVPVPTQPRFTPHPATQAPAPPASQPPIRRGAAFTGLWVSLLAGAAGFVSNQAFYQHPARTYIVVQQALFVVPMAVAVAAMVVRRQRRAVLGVLQGMWWPSAAWLAWDIVARSKMTEPGSPASQYVGYYAGVAAHVLGVIAATLLLASWRPNAGQSRARGGGALRVLLVGCITVSQIAWLFVFGAHAYYAHAYYAQGVAALVVGLAVGLYAASLRSVALGGALALGWAVTTGIWLVSTMLLVYEYPDFTFTRTALVSAQVELVLLIMTILLAVIYMRSASDPDLHRSQSS